MSREEANQPAEMHVNVLRELKRRTPIYTGEEPKAAHYQAVHAAYDAAIDALSGVRP